MPRVFTARPALCSTHDSGSGPSSPRLFALLQRFSSVSAKSLPVWFALYGFRAMRVRCHPNFWTDGL